MQSVHTCPKAGFLDCLQLFFGDAEGIQLLLPSRFLDGAHTDIIIIFTWGYLKQVHWYQGTMVSV